MRKRKHADVSRLRVAIDRLKDAERTLAAARFEASAALGCAIEHTIQRRNETRTSFAARHGISKAHVSDMIYGRRYSPVVAEALAAQPDGGEG